MNGMITGQEAILRCRCGEIQGRLTNAFPRMVTRIVCYCDDCQAYLHHLGRSDLLDAHGGTDIVQVAPASVTFERGAERIAGVRLTAKGLHRWYATCCKTPVGNTMTPSVPFIGIVAQAFEGGPRKLDDVVGKPIGAILGKYAVGTAPEGSTKLNLRLLLRAVGAIAGWRLRGKAWPNPFFDRATGEPKWPLTTLAQTEREALRPYCGPNPTTVTELRGS
ncbi:DUF6151 family protein [Pendulispora rubella]|uniref:DUF6151 family protein n=1 Tax=Pendulispora rubella TaxID=2741070 RepID=A0ABZ2KXE7_9BACT